MRRWLIALAALAIVLLGADFGLRLLAEYWVGRGLESDLSLDERPSVSIGAFPFAPELVNGNFDSVTVQANGSSRAEAPSYGSLTLTLHDVSFSPGQLVVGARTTITAMGGEGTAELTERDVNRAVGASVPVTVHLRGGRVAIRWDQSEQEVTATASISGGEVVLDPVVPSLPALSVDLPELVEGLTYRGVRIERGAATLSFTLGRTAFEIGRS